MMPSERNGASLQRLGFIDATRGLAIIGVVIFHFVWDLEFAGFISGVAFHPIWLAFGKTLAGSFMVLVGVSLLLAHQKGFKLNAFLKRFLVIALAASIISIVTWLIFPESFIYFGILHAIAVASLVGIAFLKLPAYITLTVGVFILLAPTFYASAIFDTRWLAWIGFSRNPPTSNDFVPVFPWLGLTLIGMATTKLIQSLRWPVQLSSFSSTNQIVNLLQWFGRKSLPIYLIHQPILLAIILPLSSLL